MAGIPLNRPHIAVGLNRVPRTVFRHAGETGYFRLTPCPDLAYHVTIVRDYGSDVMQATIGAGDFKAKCLQLLDEVALTKESLVITKRGKPVAKLVPVPSEIDLYGALEGSVVWEGDIVSPLENDWDACK